MNGDHELMKFNPHSFPFPIHPTCPDINIYRIYDRMYLLLFFSVTYTTQQVDMMSMIDLQTRPLHPSVAVIQYLPLNHYPEVYTGHSPHIETMHLTER